jgi:hypothetical protein
MVDQIVGLLVFAGLFVAFGLMNRRMGAGNCSGHSCGTDCGSGGCSPQATDHHSEAHDDEKNPAGWWAY